MTIVNLPLIGGLDWWFGRFVVSHLPTKKRLPEIDGRQCKVAEGKQHERTIEMLWLSFQQLPMAPRAVMEMLLVANLPNGTCRDFLPAVICVNCSHSHKGLSLFIFNAQIWSNCIWVSKANSRAKQEHNQGRPTNRLKPCSDPMILLVMAH